METQSATETNALAIVSLVFGVIGWTLMPLIGNVVAIICGHIARGQIRQSGGSQQGDGLALAGLILGYLGLAVGVAVVLMIIFGIGIIAVISALA
jgi:hypothetical protein